MNATQKLTALAGLMVLLWSIPVHAEEHSADWSEQATESLPIGFVLPGGSSAETPPVIDAASLMKRAAELMREIEKLEGEARNDLNRSFFNLALERYRMINARLNQRAEVLEVLYSHAPSLKLRVNAAEQLEATQREQERAQAMLKLLVVR